VIDLTTAGRDEDLTRWPDRISRLRNRRQRGVSAGMVSRSLASTSHPAALAKATAKAATVVGVPIRFVEDNPTALRHRLGTFDLPIDYRTLDGLSPANRARYADNVIPLAGPDARFLPCASNGRADDWIAGCASRPPHRARWSSVSATPCHRTHRCQRRTPAAATGPGRRRIPYDSHPLKITAIPTRREINRLHERTLIG
jgi:hypothetical protein